MTKFFGVLFFQRVQVPYRRLKPELLARGKVVYREVCTEGSQTAKSGTDEQKRHMRQVKADKRPQQRNVQSLPKL